MFDDEHYNVPISIGEFQKYVAVTIIFSGNVTADACANWLPIVNLAMG